MALRVTRGLFRLWLVFSVLWVGGVAITTWWILPPASDDFIPDWVDQAIKSAVLFAALPPALILAFGSALVWAFGGFREIKSGATTSPPLPLEKADCEQDGEHQPHSLGRFFDMSKNKTPAEKLHDIYFALGVAIAQWQQVEMALTQLFVLLINSDGGAASAAFNRVHSPMNRLEMVMASASVRLKDNPTLFNECTTICKRLKNEVKKRNQLAHFSLYQRPPESIENAEDVDWYLRPTAFDGAIEWRYKHGVPELTTNEIKDCIASFQKAAKELWDFSEKVRAALSEKT